MAEVVYVLCALTSAACATLLLRSYAQTRHRLLLWSGICFVGFFFNNLMLIVDKVLTGASVDLSLWTKVPAFIGLACMVYGLVWEDDT